jgi:cytochrome c oxidase subunit 2
LGGANEVAAHPFLARLADSFWLPVRASSTAGEVDTVFYVIFAISFVFFALIVALMVWFAIRYRRREGHSVERSSHANVRLEIAWTIVPTLLVILIFWLGFRTFLDVSTPPANAYQISVTGQKWQWFFTYPNGYVTSELHVPVNQPVHLTMTSEDVIHSLWIPAFRVKKDVVPGRYNTTWFEATAPGEYPLLCTEYCGTGHSDMLSRVIVHEPGLFEVWLREASDRLGTLPPAEAGRQLYETKGCAQCHSIDGSALIGPTFKDLYGTENRLKDGSTVRIEDNYIRESIVDPMAKIVAGYDPVMPTYAGKLKDQEITMLIAFFKSISRYAESDELSAAPASEAAADSAVPPSADAVAEPEGE